MWLGKTRGVVLINFQVLPRVSHIVQILYLLLLLFFFSHCSNPLCSVFTCQSLAQGVTNQMACQNRIRDPISASYGTSMTLTLQKIIFFLCCWGSHIKNALFSFSFLTLLLITTPTIIICKEKKKFIEFDLMVLIRLLYHIWFHHSNPRQGHHKLQGLKEQR